MLYEKDFVPETAAIVSESENRGRLTPDTVTIIVQPEKTDLEMPTSIWITMFAAYAVFFAGLIAATAHDKGTIFVIFISILYTFMYFGLASVLFTQNRPVQASPFSRGLAPLATYTGSMEIGAVIGQVLTIPACLALFGVTMALFRAMIFI